MGFFSWLFDLFCPIENEEVIEEIKEEPQKETVYKLKDNLLTKIEREFFTVFKETVGDKYIVQPQVNLASIITKESESFTRHNELFRNIDFGIFTKEEYTPLLLIEINDSTHKQPDRIARDKKVKEICEEAEIPLITFWTEYGINKEYIRNRFKKYIEL